eukprot:COSAG02_NODE_4774_length_4994_cov_1.223902_2_plen_1320_part_00
MRQMCLDGEYMETEYKAPNCTGHALPGSNRTVREKTCVNSSVPGVGKIFVQVICPKKISTPPQPRKKLSKTSLKVWAIGIAIVAVSCLLCACWMSALRGVCTNCCASCVQKCRHQLQLARGFVVRAAKECGHKLRRAAVWLYITFRNTTVRPHKMMKKHDLIHLCVMLAAAFGFFLHGYLWSIDDPFIAFNTHIVRNLGLTGSDVKIDASAVERSFTEWSMLGQSMQKGSTVLILSVAVISLIDQVTPKLRNALFTCVLAVVMAGQLALMLAPPFFIDFSLTLEYNPNHTFTSDPQSRAQTQAALTLAFDGISLTFLSTLAVFVFHGVGPGVFLGSCVFCSHFSALSRCQMKPRQAGQKALQQPEPGLQIASNTLDTNIVANAWFSNHRSEVLIAGGTRAQLQPRVRVLNWLACLAAPCSSSLPVLIVYQSIGASYTWILLWPCCWVGSVLLTVPLDRALASRLQHSNWGQKFAQLAFVYSVVYVGFTIAILDLLRYYCGQVGGFTEFTVQFPTTTFFATLLGTMALTLSYLEQCMLGDASSGGTGVELPMVLETENETEGDEFEFSFAVDDATILLNLGLSFVGANGITWPRVNSRLCIVNHPALQVGTRIVGMQIGIRGNVQERQADDLAASQHAEALPADGSAAFFEQLLDSMGIGPTEAVEQYAAAFVDAGALLVDFEEASLEELASDYGFKKLHIRRVETYRSAKITGGGTARTSVGGTRSGLQKLSQLSFEEGMEIIRTADLPATLIFTTPNEPVETEEPLLRKRVWDWMLEKRERADPRLYGRRLPGRRFQLILGILICVYMLIDGYEQSSGYRDGYELEYVQANVKSLVAGMVWPHGNGTVLDHAITVYGDYCKVTYMAQCCAVLLLVCALWCDVSVHNGDGLNASRLYGFVGLGLMFLSELLPAFPDYLHLSHMDTIVPCCAKQFNFVATTLLRDIVGIACAALFSARLLPVLLAVPYCMVRTCTMLVLDDISRVDSKDLKSCTKATFSRSNVHATIALSSMLTPLFTAIPMTVILQFMRYNGHGLLVSSMLLLFYVGPIALSLLRCDTLWRAEGRLLLWCVMYAVPLVVLMFYEADQYGKTKQLWAEIEQLRTVADVLVEVFIANVILSDIMLSTFYFEPEKKRYRYRLVRSGSKVRLAWHDEGQNQRCTRKAFFLVGCPAAILAIGALVSAQILGYVDLPVPGLHSRPPLPSWPVPKFSTNLHDCDGNTCVCQFDGERPAFPQTSLPMWLLWLLTLVLGMFGILWTTITRMAREDLHEELLDRREDKLGSLSIQHTSSPSLDGARTYGAPPGDAGGGVRASSLLYEST